MKKKKRTKRKKKRTKSKSKSKKILLCFTMKGCHWCHEFEQNLWPKIKQHNLCSFKIIEREKNPKLINKYKIKIYPSLVLVTGKKHKRFTKKRSMNNILKFCK